MFVEAFQFILVRVISQCKGAEAMTLQGKLLTADTVW